jgi:hypothetical protein
LVTLSNAEGMVKGAVMTYMAQHVEGNWVVALEPVKATADWKMYCG